MFEAITNKNKTNHNPQNKLAVEVTAVGIIGHAKYKKKQANKNRKTA
ncbi:hypothetical protein [Virgibacillus sp. DJP39]